MGRSHYQWRISRANDNTMDELEILRTVYIAIARVTLNV